MPSVGEHSKKCEVWDEKKIVHYTCRASNLSSYTQSSLADNYLVKPEPKDPSIVWWNGNKRIESSWASYKQLMTRRPKHLCLFVSWHWHFDCLYLCPASQFSFCFWRLQPDNRSFYYFCDSLKFLMEKVCLEKRPLTLKIFSEIFWFPGRWMKREKKLFWRRGFESLEKVLVRVQYKSTKKFPAHCKWANKRGSISQRTSTLSISKFGYCVKLGSCIQ